MRGLDALAAACEPAPEPAAPETLNISADMCEKIADLVLQRLQSGLAEAEKPEKVQPEEPEPAEDPEEGEMEDGVTESL